MTAAGWYRGEGDPPGTQRYWDGRAWVGDPVYEPPVMSPPPPVAGAGQAYPSPAVRSTFPGSLKVIAIVLSVVKAIPLAFGAVLVIWLAIISNSLDDEFDELGFGLDGLLGAAIAFLVVLLVVGALLLGFQFAGAMSERPIMLFVPALIMAILDVLFMVGAWSDYSQTRNSSFAEDSSGGAILITAVAAAQVFVAVQAIRANRK